MSKPTAQSELTGLLEKNGERVRAVLNVLLESPYFYSSDDSDLFFFLKRHRREFSEFFEQFYGWTLLLDSKCARVFKTDWKNPAIPASARSMFNFTRRDECLAFMMLLEFYEHQLEENGMTVEDKDNLRFRFGDLLAYVHRRFLECFDDKSDTYSEDFVRAKILKPIMPELERYRFLKKLPPPGDLKTNEDDLIFEALPAIYHYNGAALGRLIPELATTQDLGACPRIEAVAKS